MSSHKNELILSAIATIADNIELSYEFGLFADNAKREGLLAFNNSVTYPHGATDKVLSFGEGMHWRKVILTFLIIQCRSSFKGILVRFRRIIYKNVLASESITDDGFTLDSCKDEVIPTLDDKLEFVQLGENPPRSVKIGFTLSPKVRSMLTECLQVNVGLFAISPHEMLGIDP
ncbi:hypothetical protein KIW84_074371 [Lathyrus oleraceus]|uniref:Uncharacterized protein n=1 Tax=Pisum sativum TaxID=3888 RepID=A0A9D4ZYH6_PEA|nr:hypothetical protein KIW84_074371 [Pisum sativum]